MGMVITVRFNSLIIKQPDTITLPDKTEFEHCLFPHESERHTYDFLKRQHKSIDLDKNAKLSRQELEESPIFKGFDKGDAESELKFENWDSDQDESVSLEEFNDFMRKLMTQKRRTKADAILKGVDVNGDRVFQLTEFLGNAGLLSKSALTKFGLMYHDEL